MTLIDLLFCYLIVGPIIGLIILLRIMLEYHGVNFIRRFEWGQRRFHPPGPEASKTWVGWLLFIVSCIPILNLYLFIILK